MAKSILFCFGMLLGIQTAGFAQQFHTSPICWNNPRTFFPDEQDNSEMEAWKRSHRIDTVQVTIPDDYQLSPNGVYAYHLQQEQSDAYRLLVFNERPYLVELSIANIRGIQDLKWVNEKIIHLRVWLGRIAGVDVLFDVELEKIVLAEPFNNGQLALQQWRESCETDRWKDTEICNPRCYRLEDSVRN